MVASLDQGKSAYLFGFFNQYKRGELMLRKDKIYPWKDILNLTDQEFVEKMKTNVEVIKIFYKISMSIGIEHN